MKWAANELKLNRAIAKLGKEATEEEIKAEYIKMGGLIVEPKEVNTYTLDVQEAVIDNNPAVSFTSETITVPKKK